ncbi:MAG: NADH-quinone oxidoreductase subunit J [Pseudomonadota bacterium]
MIEAVAFYIFAAMIVLAALAVISARNPVHSVLFLIFAFFNAAGLLVLLGAEFLAMILVIVYVGAVAVLFLFVVMMLDIDLKNLHQGFMRAMPLGIGLAVILLAELGFALSGNALQRYSFLPEQPQENTRALGNLLYTHHIFLFQLAGLILLVAMVGAIVLTLRHRTTAKRQRIGDQINRSTHDEVELVKLKPGEGAPMQGQSQANQPQDEKPLKGLNQQ